MMSKKIFKRYGLVVSMCILCFLTLAPGHSLAEQSGSNGQGKDSVESGGALPISGCSILPANNIWNTPIDTLPVDANSAAYVNTIGSGSHVHADFGSGLWDGGPIGIPFITVPGTQPKVAVRFDYDDESDPGPYPIPPEAPIEGGVNSDGDRHILILDKDNCILYELYYAYPQLDGSWTAGSGAIYDLKSNGLRPAGWTSADAAGLPILPGLIRYEEVKKGEINHAIRFTVPKTRKKYVWPGRHYASSLTGSQYPPMGQRFRLKADYDISGFSADIQVILRALKKYGMILSDNGSAWFISGVPDSRWNNSVLHQLHNVKGSAFEAVNVSSLMVNANSGEAKQGNTSKTITLTSPNGGEIFAPGSSQMVTWTSSGGVGNVMIKYSTDNGSSWTVITSSTANDGVYAWMVPDVSSTKCKVKVVESDGSPYDKSDAAFTIGSGGSAATLTLISPNGGEKYEPGSVQTIKWSSTGEVGNVMLKYSKDSGSSWTVIINSTANDGSYAWTVPSVSSTKCKVKVYVSGSLYDKSNAVFTIGSGTTTPGKVMVTSPNEGSNWTAGTTHTITWTSEGDVDKVKIKLMKGSSKIQYISTSTDNDGSYSWTLPTDLKGGTDYSVKIWDTTDTTVTDSSDSFTITAAEPEVPKIKLNRKRLNFCYISTARATNTQKFLIKNSGSGTLNWSAAADENWLSVDPNSGTGKGVAYVTVSPGDLPAGEYTAKVTVSDPNAENSPQTLDVHLKVKTTTDDQPPFGSFDTPVDGSTVSSSIPVTGWAMDDVGVKWVKIYRQDGSNLKFIGDAVFVEGARTDIESNYEGYPNHYQGGWGYMLLSHFLPNGGNGTYTLVAIAKDTGGNETILGSKTIICDNSGAVKPFGAIDTPAQGGVASGNAFINFGWSLTPNPNAIPVNGSTIWVYIDGVKVGQPVYNNYRQDIATLFPGFANSNGAIGYIYLDTTTYENGTHIISWSVTDDAGNIDGIGSRYFNIQNTGADAFNRQASGIIREIRTDPDLLRKNVAVLKIPRNRPSITVTKGDNQQAAVMQADETGTIIIDAKPLEILNIDLGKKIDVISHLPVGATIDQETNMFHWQIGPGFLNRHQLIFLMGKQRLRVIVNIRAGKREK